MPKKNLIILAILSILISSSCMKRYYHKKSLEHRSNELKCISKSEQWILTNSKFPSSYIKVSFSKLRESSMVEPKGFIIKVMKTVPNSERFSIIHKYYLQDSIGKSVLNYSKFIYDKNFYLKGFYSSLTDSTVNIEVMDELNWKSTYGK
jgi:poly(3-hydroxyalkanoate) synthetase